MNVEDFLSGPIFRYGAFPLLSAGGGILLRCATRNDKYAFFKKEDMAVGPQLMLTAILTYVVVTTDRARDLVGVNDQLARTLKAQPLDQTKFTMLQADAYSLSQLMMSAAWTLLVLTVGLWGVTILVKRWGWLDEAQLDVRLGIAAPLFIGVASLMYVMMAASR